MEAQIIQARSQVVFVGNSGHCEDCEEEERQEELKEDIAQDRVNLSPASLELAQNSSSTNSSSENSRSGDNSTGEDGENTESQTAGPKTELQLSEEERRILNELKARDAEVRAHEAAHLAAAGPYANGAPTFEFQTGRDGRQYATDGEVSIDTSPVPGDPEATVRKTQTIKRAAALAPREPSGQDRQVAAQAAQLEAQARQEVQAKRAEENEETSEKNNEENSISKNSDNTTNSSAANTLSENQNATNTARNEEFTEESPFTRRVTNNFSPSRSSSGNLLNIIS